MAIKNSVSNDFLATLVVLTFSVAAYPESIFLEHFRSTKCELAKVMNQQTCFQELLQHKDQAIKSLERKAGASHMNGSLKKDSKTR